MLMPRRYRGPIYDDDDDYVNWCVENDLDPDSKWSIIRWAEMMDDSLANEEGV